MKCISVLFKYFPTVTYVVGYVIFSVVTCVVNHATFLFNSTVTFLNLLPTVGPKYPNDESTTCNHNDGSLCRRRELMCTVAREEIEISGGFQTDSPRDGGGPLAVRDLAQPYASH